MPCPCLIYHIFPSINESNSSNKSYSDMETVKYARLILLYAYVSPGNFCCRTMFNPFIRSLSRKKSTNPDAIKSVKYDEYTI